MKLVFFDIECASVHKTYAKICAFGYVVCDGNFNILEKEDILINPKGRFELTDRKGEKGIVLPYEYEDFKKYPPFKAVYPRIKQLLEDKESYILGHAVLNDVKYLNLETRRYKLPPFNFEFSDSQLLFMTHTDDFSRQFGLEHIANALGVEFTPHRAADDAYATMKIVEALCKTYGCDFPELVKKLNVVPGKISNGQITRPQSKGFKRFNAQKKAERQERSQKRIEFFNNLSHKRVNRAGGALKGKTITFSRAIEDNIELSIPLVDKIYAAGGRYSPKLDRCNIYISESGDATARTKSASANALPRMTVDELQELLND